LPSHPGVVQFEKDLKGKKQITEREEIETNKSITK
jgi:hypothetical protein